MKSLELAEGVDIVPDSSLGSQHGSFHPCGNACLRRRTSKGVLGLTSGRVAHVEIATHRGGQRTPASSIICKASVDTGVLSINTVRILYPWTQHGL
jgi:hypothetical protein